MWTIPDNQERSIGTAADLLFLRGLRLDRRLTANSQLMLPFPHRRPRPIRCHRFPERSHADQYLCHGHGLDAVLCLGLSYLPE